MITNADRIKEAVSMAQLCASLGQKVSKKRCPCPVHKGKKNNFKVNGRYGVCFSQCGGKSWDTVELLMELRNCTYPEALQELARIGGITVERTEKQTPEEIARYQEAQRYKSSLADNLKLALDLYPRPECNDDEVLDIEGRTLKGGTLKSFDIFISPPTSLVLRGAQVGKADEELLIEMGILRKSKEGRTYDPFSNRILFPIHDHHGKLVGLTGRVTETNQSKAKYSNTSESPIFHKREILYGLKQNAKNIAQYGAVLVEGNMDVVTMYDHHLRCAVAAMGTAVTEEQLKLLRRYTNKLVVLMDADEAGKKSAISSATLALALDFDVRIAYLPVGEDPDSFLRESGRKDAAAQLKNIIDRAGSAYEQLIEHHLDCFDEDEGLQRIAEIIAGIQHDYLKMRCDDYLENALGKSDKRLKLIQGRVAAIIRKKKEEDEKPKYSKKEAEQIEKFMLFERGNRLHVASRVDGQSLPLTNFTIRPVMQVIGSQESRVLMELKNLKGQCATIEINTDSMTEIGPFKKEVMRRGHFVFDEAAKTYHFARVINYVFDRLPVCHPLTVLGWNENQKFYAWANGLSLPDGEFKPIDDYGIVKHGEHMFFLPAFSSVHVNNPGDDTSNGYENMRGFVLDTKLNCPTIKEWSGLFRKVHGDNGMIGVAWYLSCIYRSYIFEQFGCFVMLNHFGQPGSGKSFMAHSLTAMFGESRNPFNLHDGTDVGLFRRMAQTKDAVVFLDEFNNQIMPKRFQAIKNFYDGAGREKGQKTHDNRTTTTPVTSGVILVGQQQPTQDPALFSRVISLDFEVKALTEAEVSNARKLKEIEGTACLSQITAKLITHRETLKQRYLATYDEIVIALGACIPKGVPRNVVARLTKNNAMVLAAFKIISELEDFAFTYDELFEYASKVMVKQLVSIGQEDDLATWWEMVNYAIRKGLLMHDNDLEVSHTSAIKLTVSGPSGKEEQTFSWGGEEKKLLYLHVGTAYREYSRLLRQEGKDNGMPKTSIQHYLKGSESFLGEGAKKIGGRSKRVYVFDVARLPFDIELSTEYFSAQNLSDDDAPVIDTSKSPGSQFPKDGNDLPF